MAIKGVGCAIQAGCCAAMASVSAKLAASSDTASKIVSFGLLVMDTTGFSFPVSEKLQPELTILVRLIGVAGIFLFNALMWVLFTKSMHLCSSTLEATAFNTSSNFFFTAVLGKVLFGEHLGLLWCLGSALMVIGLAVLHSGSSKESKDSSSQFEQPQDELWTKKKT